MQYTIYDKNTGIILRKIECPENMISIQLQLNEEYIEGNYNNVKQKILNKIVVDKSQTEIDDYKFKQIKDTIPNIDYSINDVDLDILLNDYFMNKVNIKQWRIDNYKKLRKLSYPSINLFLDAYVKINSEIPELINQGQNQLNTYIQNSLNVKNKFPKK